MSITAERLEVEVTPSKLEHFKAVILDRGRVIASAIVADRGIEEMTTVLHRGRFYSLVRKESGEVPIWYYHPSRLLVVEGAEEPKTEPRAVPTQGKFVRMLPPVRAAE